MTISLLILFHYLLPLQESVKMWDLFEKVPFQSTYIESEKASFYIPAFTDEVLEWKDKTVTITGYYLPIDIAEKAIVLSRHPMATCFFCGEAGPESVVMVYPARAIEDLTMDQKVTFEGRLELNDRDVYQLSFILLDAVRL